MIRNTLQTGFAVVATILMVTTPVAGAVSFETVGSYQSDTNPENSNQSLSPASADTSVDARILNFNQQSGEYTAGEQVSAEVEIQNTGDTDHTFFVGYSVQGPNGNWYDNSGGTGQTVTLAPGESRWITLSWTVEDGAPTGYYDAVTSVWKESDRDNLQTRLDSARRSTAFQVVEPSIDASITDFDVETGEYSEGDSVSATATVENTGNTENTFFVGYSVVGPNGDYYDNNGQTGRTVTLSPGERRSVALSWTVESGAPTGYYDARASVWEESDRDNLYTRLDDTRQNGAFEVVEPTEIDARLVSVDVVSGDYIQGDSVDATATVENTGNTEHTFFVGYSVIGPNGGSYDNDGTTGRSVTLSPGEQRSVPLSWTVESNAPTGTYDARASVWKESDRNNLNTRLDDERQYSAFEVVDATDINGRIVDFDVEAGEFQEGDSVSATAVVENTGNTEHTYFVGYSVVGPDGNSYDNDGQTGRTVTLDPGERRTISLDWTVESDAPTGDYGARASIWKESDRSNLNTRLDDEYWSNAFSVVEPTDVNGRIVDFDVESGEYTTDESVDATAVVENTGNTRHTFFVGYSVFGPEGDYYDNAGGTGQTVTLDPGERRQVSLSWEVESGAPAGTYDAETSIWRESDRDSLQTRLDESHRSSTFSVVQTIQARITDFDVSSGTFLTGESVSASVTVENTGDAEHTYFVGYGVRGPEGDTYDNNGQTGQSITLAPGEVRTVDVSWTVEENVPDGSYEALAAVWKESDRDALATRLDAETNSDAFDVASTQVRVDNFAVEPETIRHDGQVHLSSQITNGAQSGSSISLRFEVQSDGASWRIVDTRALNLDPDETRTVATQWEPSEEAENGSYDVRVTIRESSTQDEPTDEVVKTDAVTVTRASQGSIEALHLPNTFEPEEEYTVDVRLHNPTSIERTYQLSLGETPGVRSPEEARDITIRGGGFQTVSIPVTFDEGVDSRTVEVRLESAEGDVLDTEAQNVSRTTTVLEVVAIDENGDPISDVPVDPYLPDLEERMTGEDGKVKYTNVSNGDAIIFLEDLRERGFVTKKPTPTFETTIDQGERNTVVVEYERSATLAGTVEQADGTAISDATVRVAGEGHRVDVSQNGEFEIRGLEPGVRYTFEVWQGSDRLTTERRSFSPGETSVSLSVPNQELEESSSIRDRLSRVAADLVDDTTTARKDEIFQNNTVVIGAESERTQPIADGEYYVADGGRYRTSGPCAWYNSRSDCETYRMSAAEGEASSRGMVGGFTAGLQESIEGLEELTQPIQYAQSIIDLVLTVMGDIGILDDLIAQLPQQVQEQQQSDNPYTQQHEPQQYEAYKQSWYAGYITYYVATAYLGTSISQYIKSSDRLSDVAAQLRDTSRARISQAVQFESKLRTEGAKQARYHIDPPSDTRQWRETIGRFADNSEIPAHQLTRYLRAVRAANNNEKIVASEHYFDDIIGQDRSKLTGTVLEAERAVRWANDESTRRVVVEPNDVGGNNGPYDLMVEKTDGTREYIEVKNTDPTTGPLTGQNIRDKVEKVQDQLEGSTLANDGSSVVTIGAKELSDELTSREQVFREIRQGLANTDTQPQFDEIRIIEAGADRPTYTFEADEFPINGADQIQSQHADAQLQDINTIHTPPASPA